MSTNIYIQTSPQNENTTFHDESFQTFTVVLDCLLLVPIFAGNLLLIVCTLRFPHLQTRSYVMVANIIFSDLVFGTILILFEIISRRPLCNVSQKAISDTYTIFVRSGLSISLTNLLLITAERYLSVLFPFRYESLVTKTSITFAILYSWISNISFSFVLAFTKNSLHQSGYFISKNACACEMSKRTNQNAAYVWLAYNLFEFSLAFFFYVSVARVTLRHLKMIHPQDDNNPDVIYELQKAKRRTAILGLFILIWLPFFVIKICEQFCWGEKVIDTVSNYGRLIFKVNYCINFFVYGATRAYRKAFNEMLCLDTNSPNVII